MGKIFTVSLYGYIQRRNFSLLLYYPFIVIFFLPSFILFSIAIYDFLQKKRSVLSNFPLLGRFRFFLESIRPELRQYYWESDDDELPYSRNQRTMVYERAKNVGGVRPLDHWKKCIMMILSG